VRHWNEIAINASGSTIPPWLPTKTVLWRAIRTVRASQDMAIVHIAAFETVNALGGGYQSYIGMHRENPTVHGAAIAQAAHDTLTALFPSQTTTFDQQLAHDLGQSRIIFPNREVSSGQRGLHDSGIAGANDGSQADPRIGVNFTAMIGGGRIRSAKTLSRGAL
jgi:hypothetical protein